MTRPALFLSSQAPTERVSEPLCGACPCAHPVLPAMLPAHGYEDWAQIHYPPAPPVEHSPPLPSSCIFRLVRPGPFLLLLELSGGVPLAAAPLPFPGVFVLRVGVSSSRGAELGSTG